jgi:aryl-alcohol dehydrogenase-like predicted oxidoreductase
MEYRMLGKTGVKVSVLAVGTMTYGIELSETEAIRLIHAAIDEGINFFDTADRYPGAEEILGKAMKGRRDSVVIATKVGVPPGGGAATYLTDPNDQGLSRKHIMKQVENSLRNLQTDYIDLYYCHFPDYDVPIEDTLNTLNDLVRQGKVLYIGCSNFTAWQLAKALGISERYNLARFQCIQSPYNLLTRDIEWELVGLCESEKVSICVYNPLAGEILTGKHQYGKPPAPGRLTLPDLGKAYFDRYWSETNFRAADEFRKLAQGRGCTLAQFAIAWILNNKAVTSVLSGFTTVEQLRENVAAIDIKLTHEELGVCDEVWSWFRPPRFFYAKDMRIRKQ